MLSQTRESAALAGQLQSLGLQGCYVATFTKQVKNGSDSRSNSPGSFAFLFQDDSGASEALPAIRAFFVDSFRPTGDFADSTPGAGPSRVRARGRSAARLQVR